MPPLKNPNRWLINETRRWTSLAKKFREEEIIDEHFEIFIRNISLEDLIALKLELSAKTMNSPLYGTQLWNMLKFIVKDAILKFAISSTYTPSEAAAFLGMDQNTLFRLTRKYGMWDYFDHVYLKKMKEKMEINKQKRLERLKNAAETSQNGNEGGES